MSDKNHPAPDAHTDDPEMNLTPERMEQLGDLTQQLKDVINTDASGDCSGDDPKATAVKFSTSRKVWDELRKLCAVEHEHGEGMNECNICDEPLIESAVHVLASAKQKIAELESVKPQQQRTGDCISKETTMNELVKSLVNRFLQWKLPKEFHPDAGISFKPTKPYEGDELGNSWWPTGTNLFSADQATEMVEYMLQDIAYLQVSPSEVAAYAAGAASKDARIAELETQLAAALANWTSTKGLLEEALADLRKTDDTARHLLSELEETK